VNIGFGYLNMADSNAMLHLTFAFILHINKQPVLPEQQVNIAIFASGAGSNAAEIIKRFASSGNVRIALVVCNKPGAGVLKVAADAGIESLLIQRDRFYNGDGYMPELQIRNIDFIVLAGFLWKIPDVLIDAYPRRIINIHPALLPSYGGKGMYGEAVHDAVIGNGEKESGITIHYVDGHYDNGDIIFQAKCPVEASDTPASLAKKIHGLEHKHYPEVIENLLSQL
jgi:phosphoribosylglycinamide formyltransferase 1